MTTSGAIGQQAEPAQQVPPARAGTANPAPWAVTAFATTSFMLGMFQTGLLNNAGVLIVLPAAFFFGGLVRIIVAIVEFSRGNLFAGAVFGLAPPGPPAPPGVAGRIEITAMELAGVALVADGSC